MADTALPRLELTCLGPPTARLDGREPPVEVLWRRHLALLVYLALSPDGTRTRDHLVGLLWPEKPEDKARHALNESLRRLRHALGPERLLSHGDAITVSTAGLEVDALQFKALAERDPGRAVGLLRGDFLEGFLLDEAPAFDEWVGVERERCRARGAGALIAHGEGLLAACRFAEAGDVARRALALEPYAEPAARLLMRASALSGDAARALATYHEFCQRLASGIQEKPSREIVALSERIRHQVTRPRAPGGPPGEPPLVGREAVHRAAFEQIGMALADGPRTLIISGAPGMGRTRLLAECTRRLALEGAIVALARPLASDHDAPWSTLRLLVRSGLHRAPGLIATDADALGVLAGLVPELAERASPRPARDAAHVAAALASAVSALAEESPVALAVDDAHLSDDATLEALRAALAQLRPAPVLLVLTTLAETGTAPKALLRLRSDVGRALRGASVQLDPFSDAEVRALVGALAPWCAEDGERDRLSRRLAFETGGNPFFVITLLEGLKRLATVRADFVAWPRPQATFDTALPFSVPDLARLAIAARVAELDQESRRVLAAASIGALALDLDLLATLTDLPRAQVEDQLAAAERRHLVAFDEHRYGFTAPLIAEVVRAECLTPGQRRSLRQRAIEVLSARHDIESRVLRAELMAAVQPGPAAFEEAIAVTEAAISTKSTRTAHRAWAAAERAAAPALESLRPRLESLRAQMNP
jgi:DNA-binding SARP family transcriptional activator